MGTFSISSIDILSLLSLFSVSCSSMVFRMEESLRWIHWGHYQPLLHFQQPRFSCKDCWYRLNEGDIQKASHSYLELHSPDFQRECRGAHLMQSQNSMQQRDVSWWMYWESTECGKVAEQWVPIREVNVYWSITHGSEIRLMVKVLDIWVRFKSSSSSIITICPTTNPLQIYGTEWNFLMFAVGAIALLSLQNTF